MRELFSAFNEGEVRYLVVEAYAVIHYTEPRYTKDLDVWVDPTPANAARVIAALGRFGAPTGMIRLEDLTDLDLVFQIGIEPNRIDVLMGMEGLEFARAWERAERTRYEGVPIRILALEHLIEVKSAAGRPQDLLDLAKLEQARARRGA